MSLPVALYPCASYDQQLVDQAVAKVLDAAEIRPVPSSRLLIKPNLLRSHELTCTSPQVVAAACKYFKNFNVHLMVGDSPGFGSAKSVAEFIGLNAILAPLGLRVIDLKASRKIKLPYSKTSLSLSKIALDADSIISVPRLKAHQQMGMSIAVKNSFGCISGLGKARVHATHGARHDDFAGLILEMYDQLPPVSALVDGIVAMHVTGPSYGKPYDLGLVAASASAVAMDTAIYCIMGLAPQEVPLWEAVLKENIEGSHPKHISWPLRAGMDFDLTDFVVPRLESPSFHPWFLLKSYFRRIVARLKG